MDPKPDHGEESYRGSGRLTGKAAVITGGDSGIGRAVAIAFAREGADVLISYLNEHEDAKTPPATSRRPAAVRTGPR
jgi:NAD(P)-dependent dehydrogenase (short-subunit alcohol dehydrogenase family)